jgi:hypothetical protein
VETSPPRVWCYSTSNAGGVSMVRMAKEQPCEDSGGYHVGSASERFRDDALVQPG